MIIVFFLNFYCKTTNKFLQNIMADDWGNTVSYTNEKDQSYVSANFFI